MDLREISHWITVEEGVILRHCMDMGMPEDCILNETSEHPERFEELRTEVRYHQDPTEWDKYWHLTPNQEIPYT